MSVKPLLELKHTIISVTGAGPNIIAAAVASQRVYIYRILNLYAGAAATFTLQDTNNGALAAPWVFAAAGFLPYAIETPTNLDALFASGAGLGAQIATSASVQMNADVWWLQGP